MQPEDRPQRRHPRLRDYDYGQLGAYFVTICTHKRVPCLSTIKEGTPRLSALGEMVEREWLRTPSIRPNIVLDEHIIMPNHVHGILLITSPPSARNSTASRAGVKRPASNVLHSPSQTLGSIIRGFKAASASQARDLGVTQLWQRQFYDHVIRDDEDLNRIRDYVVTNALRWELDRLYVS